MAAMAAFTFSSCEDVPEPYTQPTKPDAPSAGEPKGTGTAADPFNIAGIIKYIENGGSADQEVYTKGKVVSVKAGSFDASFGSLLGFQRFIPGKLGDGNAKIFGNGPRVLQRQLFGAAP